MGRGSSAAPAANGASAAQRLEIGSPLTVEFTPRPLPLLYARGLAPALRRRQGQLPQGSLGLPGLVVEQRGVRVTPARIAAWIAVCGGQTARGQVPICLPEALFLGPMVRLLTDRAFPLSPLGLIHTAQRIAVRADVAPDAPLDLRCRIAEGRIGERGIEIDVGMQVVSAGTLAWEGTATLLSRAPGVRGRRTGEGPPPVAWEHAVEVEVPEDTGRRYARVSNDWNPHHLWRASARLIGFKRPIAHGMWTLARMVAAMGAAVPSSAPVAMEARFKRPILMPARARFAWRGSREAAEGICFEVRGTEAGELHLAGRVARIPHS